MRPARVFISCGQQDEREKSVGADVCQHFRDRSFEVYFAERIHSPEALTEHIFRFLRESEYFVFIDFKREKLTEDKHRGSLFVNQEYAIATFLAIPAIGFVESGVKREGIRNYQLTNAIPFTDVAEIFAALKDRTKHWDSGSVNQLALRYDPTRTTKNIFLGSPPGGTNPHVEALHRSDWYHLTVFNRNKQRHARSCMAYITGVRNLEADEKYTLPTIELHWSAIGSVESHIVSGTSRDFDAFYVVYGEVQVRFHERALGTTNPQYHLPLLGPGLYEIEFTVISENFEAVAGRYILEFRGTPESVRFEEAPPGGPK